MAKRLNEGTELFHPEDAEIAPVSIEAAQVEMAYRRIKGVYEHKTKSKSLWRAYPYHHGKRHHLGYFPTRADACLAIVQWRAAGCPDHSNPPCPTHRR